MIDGIPVFDCVIHVYDMSDENLREDESTSQQSREHMVGLQAAAHVAPGNENYPVATRWSPESVYDMVFTKGQTDLAMAQVVPIYDWYKDWFAPVQAQYEMATLYPDEVLFCGGVDPIEQGLSGALEQLDHQAKEMGARSFKFYNGHLRGSWRCDDEAVAYPLYQRCQDLGIDVIQFHKGSPFGQQNLEDLSPLDLQRAARDFPDLKFIIHHAAIPYFGEALNVASRFPNVYIALSGILNFGLVAPRMVQEWVGPLLAQVGSERLLWGSEAALQGCPLPFLEYFVHEFEIPEDLRVGYGYPQITREDKERILGRNFAELMNVDLVDRKPADRSGVA
jgi:predicted TIM-barrel fold metal-dependent hydrolase